ncbi:ABC-type sugar transport system permease subunit [Paenibacillus wynnii]|nr:ABC-type sugar transport system permease subunit [Paenibacillus wynnii]
METLTQKPPTASKRRAWSLQRGETLAGLLFVGPMLIGGTILVLIPIIATLVLGFADWNFVQGFSGIRWVGFQNFINLFQDEMFIRSVRNNYIFLLTRTDLHPGVYGIGGLD